MRTKRTLTIAPVLIALAAFALLGVFREPRSVQAQDQAPPQPERISFGMVGVTQGQTIRLSVANTQPPPTGGFPPGPTRVVLTFLDADGHRLRNRRGQVIHRSVQLGPGQATFLDLDADDLQIPPFMSRLQLRAVVNAMPSPQSDGEVTPQERNRIVASVEVFNNANGRTVFVMSAPRIDPGADATSPTPE